MKLLKKVDLIYEKLSEKLTEDQADLLEEYFEATVVTTARRDTLAYIEGMKNMYNLTMTLQNKKEETRKNEAKQLSFQHRIFFCRIAFGKNCIYFLYRRRSDIPDILFQKSVRHIQSCVPVPHKTNAAALVIIWIARLLSIAISLVF